MRIALLGGTGDIGQGLALRWAHDSSHEILIGSRDPEKARSRAEAYEDTLASHGREVDILGFANEMAADRADVVVLSVPPYHVGDTVEAVAEKLDEETIVVTPAVGLRREDGAMQYHPPSAGSVTALVAQRLPDGVPVIGAFHNLSAERLADLAIDLELDTLLVGDDGGAKATIRQLAGEIEGIRPLDGGPIAGAAAVESLTALCINVGSHNEELEDAGVRFV